MLVQNFKSKRPCHATSRQSFGKDGLDGILKGTFDVKHDANQSIVDQKYKDFHRKIRSERVFKVINSAMNESRSRLSLTPSLNRATTASKTQLKFNDVKSLTDVNNRPKDIQNTTSYIPAHDEISDVKETSEISTIGENEHIKLSTKEDEVDKVAHNMFQLQKENEALKSQIALIYDWVSEATEDSNKTNLDRITNEDTKPRVKASSGDALQAKQHVGDAQCREVKYIADNERVTALESIIFDIKMEYFQERTEKEKLRLEVDRLQDCFSHLENEYMTLSNKMELMTTGYATRLENAFDNIHKMQYSKKNKSFFQMFKK